MGTNEIRLDWTDWDDNEFTLRKGEIYVTAIFEPPKGSKEEGQWVKIPIYRFLEMARLIEGEGK